jgi:hypothetical protein
MTTEDRYIASGLSALAVLAAFMLGGCSSREHGSSSTSAKRSRDRGLFVAEYVVPKAADLGRYRVIESWVETSPRSGDRQLVVRLKGPHVDEEPRVRVVGADDSRYRGLWSERDGPPYEMWSVSDPLPEVIGLERESRRIELRRLSK